MTIKSFTTTETTSRTRTLTFTLPNLKNINSVTVNTGSVVIQSIEGDEVTVQVSGGTYTRRVQTGGSYTPEDSRIEDTYRTQTSSEVPAGIGYGTPSFPSSISYNSGGYSGTLSKYGSYTTSNPSCRYDSRFEKEFCYVTWFQGYRGTVTKPASDTRTYSYYYQYTITFDYVDNSNPTVVLLTDVNEEIYENEEFIRWEKDSFLLKIIADDIDEDDPLEYKIDINNITYVDWSEIIRNIEEECSIPYMELILGISLITVSVKDDKGGISSQSFIIKNFAPRSHGLRDVYEVMESVNSGSVGYDSLQSLKPIGYDNKTISVCELLNFLT